MTHSQFSTFPIYCVVVFGSLIFSGVNLGASSQFSDFLDGLGPAQLVGRQTLATPAIGTISFPFLFTPSVDISSLEYQITEKLFGR